MSEIKVYIANLGKYNEGEQVGAWFTPPIDFDEVKDKLGLNSQYEEYAVHDFEAPFSIGEYTSIDEINRLSELMDSIEDDTVRDNIGPLINEHFNDLEDLVSHQDTIISHSCDSLEDLVEEMVEEGLFGEVSDQLRCYIDTEALARDMAIDGIFIEVKGGLFEIVA